MAAQQQETEAVDGGGGAAGVGVLNGRGPPRGGGLLFASNAVSPPLAVTQGSVRMAADRRHLYHHGIFFCRNVSSCS
jgi:hypothetical protein